jgi:hypothetical protein
MWPLMDEPYKLRLLLNALEHMDRTIEKEKELGVPESIVEGSIRARKGLLWEINKLREQGIVPSEIKSSSNPM